MKTITKGFGLALAAAVTLPLVTAALAQSPTAPDAGQYEQNERNDERRDGREAQVGRDGSGERYRSEGEYRRHEGRRARFGGRRNRGARFLARFDTDGDGNVTRIEFAEGMKQRFEKLDVNSDGTISGDELASRGGRRRSH